MNFVTVFSPIAGLCPRLFASLGASTAVMSDTLGGGRHQHSLIRNNISTTTIGILWFAEPTDCDSPAVSPMFTISPAGWSYAIVHSEWGDG